MFRIKRLLPLLFSLVLLFCSSLLVQAQTVSSGDALYSGDFVSPQMMSLSPVSTLSTEDYGIATVATVFPHAIPSGLKTITYWPSYTTSHEVLEISLFKFCVSDYITDNSWRGCNFMSMNGNINIQNIVGMNPYMARLWIRNAGKKYELVNYYNWYGFEADEQFSVAEFEVGIDIHFNTRFKSDSDRPLSEYSRPDLTEDNLTVVWEAFSFDLYFNNTLEGEKLDNIHSSIESSNNWLQSIRDFIVQGFADVDNKIQATIDVITAQSGFIMNTINGFKNEFATWSQWLLDHIDAFRNEVLNYYNGMISNLDSWFTTLFEKMDEDQEELINGYDPGTGSAAKNEFDSSAAELEAAEGNLFGQTSYNQVDYTQFDSFFSIEAVAASMLFIKSMLEALYSALGVFGIPLTIGLVLLVFTRIIGFQNFYSGGE